MFFFLLVVIFPSFISSLFINQTQDSLCFCLFYAPLFFYFGHFSTKSIRQRYRLIPRLLLALGAIFALGATFALGAIFTLGATFTLGAIFALGAIFTLGAIFALGGDFRSGGMKSEKQLSYLIKTLFITQPKSFFHLLLALMLCRISSFLL